MNRIIDFTDQAVDLHIRNHQLVIKFEDQSERSTPAAEVAAVILSAWRLTISKHTMEELARNGAVIIVCDEAKMPVGMMTPLCGHHLQSRCVRDQASASDSTLNRLWKQIVQAKISAQGQLLKSLYDNDYHLKELSNQVKSGDKGNLEGRAARIYWSKLFGSKRFRRNPDDGDPLNCALNYGYAVLRGILARAIVSSGLIPSLGLFHHNKYNPFCLADDLMEPFRPVVDSVVWSLDHESGLNDGLTVPVKQRVIGQITGRYILDDCQEAIFEMGSRLTASLAAVFGGRGKSLCLPERLPFAEKILQRKSPDGLCGGTE